MLAFTLTAMAFALARPPSAAAATDAQFLCLRAPPPAMLKDVDRTIAACTSVIGSESPQRADLGRAYARRALMYSVKKDWKASAQDGDQAVALLPDDVQAVLNRGIALRHLKRDYEAVVDYTTAIRLSPHFAYSYVARGSAYLDQARWDEAVADFRRAVKEDPHLTQGLSAACLALAIKGEDLEDAATMCNRAIKFTVNDADPYTSRAVLRLRLGQPADALADARTALRFRPSDSDALLLKGLAEQRLGQADAARADLAAAEAGEAGITAKYARRGFPAG